MVALEVAGWLRQYWPHNAHVVHLHTVTTIALLIIRIFAFACIFYYVQGRNWARIAVLLASILTILGLLRLNHEDTPGQVIGAASGLLGIFFLYWLNTSPLREFFKRGAATVAS